MNSDRSILHVDDDPAVTNFVQRQLGQHGFDVTVLNNPALVLGELVLGNYQVVILDIGMDNYNGLRLLEQIKLHDAGIQVITLTGMITSNTLLEAKYKGALTCCFKPITNIETLLNAVHVAFGLLDQWEKSLRELLSRCLEHDEDVEGRAAALAVD